MAPDPRPDQPPGPPPAPPQASVDERQLVELVLRRDRKAAARFVDEYADAVYAYVRHRLAPRAEAVEDVVQDVFLAAFDGLPRFTGSGGLRAWLIGIARHKIEDYYRRQLRAPESLEDGIGPEDPVSNEPLVDDVLDRERLEARTHRVLRQLPEAYAVVLLWRYWENRSARDMADATGRTEKAIERLLARARARFRQLWDRV
jgi:RNA polymerase sigma-70 factor (ECF subfamily)